VPLSGARQAIAARMVAGVTQSAPVTLTLRADATNLVSFRAQFQTAGGPAPSVNALLLCLTARVLRRHPRLQAQWHTDGLYYPEGVHLAFGVDTDAGLFAPVIRDANRRPLAEIARESRRLIESARSGNLSPEEMRGATFTVTNLGMFGIEAFTPIITLPQCAVLGVGRIGREAMVIEDRVVPRDALTLSLTFDHRAVDGAPAARFLDGVRKAIEAPAPWLLE
jgi:pyruvate dehydrogenase E2 component (dihydrolipoamide acetyltransferase)